jgi:DNA polymerase elongation subunit (family B)
MLNERCLKNATPSPAVFHVQTGRPYIKGRTHIDLYEVFKKEVVKSTVLKNKYRTLKLEAVVQALLGKSKFGEVSGAITGANVGDMPVDTRKSYVLQDARLVAELAELLPNTIDGNFVVWCQFRL